MSAWTWRFFFDAAKFTSSARVAPDVAQKAADSFLCSACQHLREDSWLAAGHLRTSHFLGTSSWFSEATEENAGKRRLNWQRWKDDDLKKKTNWKDNEGFYFEGGFLFNWHLWQVMMILFKFFFLNPVALWCMSLICSLKWVDNTTLSVSALTVLAKMSLT